MIFELVIIFSTIFIPLIWFFGGYQLLGHDIGYHLNVISHEISLLFSWNSHINFGVDWVIQAPKSMLLMTFPEGFLSIFIQNQQIVQLLITCFWFVLPGITMWFFVREIYYEDKYRFFRIYSSLFSILNFFLLQGWQIFEKTKFSVYAAFPLMILLLYRLFIQRKQIVKNSILMGLLFFIFNGGGLLPLFGAIFVAFGMFMLFMVIFDLHSRENYRKSILVLFLLGLFVFGLSAYSIIPTIGESLNAFNNIVSNIGGTQTFLEWEQDISKNASILNLLRLEGIPDWYGNPSHPYANQFIFKRSLVMMSFFPILIVIIGTFVFGIKHEVMKSRRYLLLYIWILFVIGVIFAGGSHPPFGNLYEFALLHIPGFVIFRSSFYKFAQLVWFPVIFLSGYYLSLLIEKYGRRKILKKMFAGFCIIGIGLYHYPFFSKTLFDFRSEFSTRLQIPQYVTKMADKMKTRVTSEDRILLYPPLDMGYIGSPLDASTWGYYSLDALPRMITNRTIVANDLYGPLNLVDVLQQSLHDGDSQTLLSYASISGITHVLWRGDVKRSEAMDRDISLVDMENRLSTMSALSKEVSEERWSLYKINASVRPMIYVSNKVEYTNTSASQSAYLLKSLPNDTVLLKTDDEQMFFEIQDARILPDIVFTEKNPTKYSIEIANSSDKPYILVFNQKFDLGWRATAHQANGDTIILQKHYEANSFANAWVVDQSSVKEIELEYMHQRYFYYGLVVTGCTIIGIVIYMIKTRKSTIIKKRK